MVTVTECHPEVSNRGDYMVSVECSNQIMILKICQQIGQKIDLRIAVIELDIKRKKNFCVLNLKSNWYQIVRLKSYVQI